MDPALQEQLLPSRDANEIIDAIIRLQAPFRFPDKIKVVSQFGDIVTVRVRRGDVKEVYQNPAVRSFKAKRILGSLHQPTPENTPDLLGYDSSPKQLKTSGAAGKGVVIAILDWGADFVHADFIKDDGTTRFLSIWDQRGSSKTPNKYGYGNIISKDQINSAIQSKSPYTTLGYKPDDGSHGTFVAGIAAGNGRSGKRGVAPEADLLFVHLSANERILNPRLDLGDSVGLLEALDFVRLEAGEQPLVINMSLGAHGGSHDGNSLVEIAMDNFLTTRPNTMICQSVGNYYSSKTHHQNTILPGKESLFAFRINERESTDNELEIWYSGQDVFGFYLKHPDSGIEVYCGAGENNKVLLHNKEVGRVYSRRMEPNTQKNQINLFLDKIAPPGKWEIRLYGQKITDGRYHAWIERNNGKNRQATFEPAYANPLSSNGTICNGFYSIVVGSVSPDNKLSVFSSSGPTTDGRSKPDILAPGEKIIGPRAAPANVEKIHQTLKSDTGTSFSTPQVTGTVALMLEHAQQPVDASTLRTLLLSASTPLNNLDVGEIIRSGNGLLNTSESLNAMIHYQQQLTKQKNTMQNAYFDNYLEQVAPSTPFASAGSAGTVFLRVDAPTGRSLPYLAGSPINFPSLDEAMRAALVRGRNSCVIQGSLFSGGSFTLHELNLPMCPITPPVIRFQPSIPNICCLIFDGFAPYFPSNIVQPADRWDQFPDLGAFYAQNQATQTNQRNLWLGKMINTRQIVNPHITINNTTPSASLINRLSIPELRLLLVQFAEHLFPIRDIDQSRNGHRWIGAEMKGATLINLPIPLSEPTCYLKVISNREGQVESINAYDGGAGISLGTVQFNAQNKALHKFLWKVWQQDNALFTIAFSPLGWSMEASANGDSVLIISPSSGATPIRIRSTDTDRFIHYLHSGDPAVNTRNIPFRRRVTECFRLLVVRSHIQAMINEVAIEVYAVPGLELIHRNGIPPLDTSRPSLELFQLKSALLSAYVRATGCAGNLIRALRRYASVHEKLSHLHQTVDHLSNIGNFNCASALRDRLRSQVREAQSIFQEVIQNMRTTNPPATTPPSGTSPVVAPSSPPVSDLYADNYDAHTGDDETYIDDYDSSLWGSWNHQDSVSESKTCDCVENSILEWTED